MPSVNPLKTRAAVFEMVSANIQRIPGSNKFEYLNGQSDHKIGEALGVPHWVVLRVRQNEFGVLGRHARKRPPTPRKAPKAPKVVVNTDPVPEAAQHIINNTILSMLRMRNDIDALQVEMARIAAMTQRLCDELDVKFMEKFNG